jgi:hypothetical protein
MKSVKSPTALSLRSYDCNLLVERVIGNDEVASSILAGGTSFFRDNSNKRNATRQLRSLPFFDEIFFHVWRLLTPKCARRINRQAFMAIRTRELGQ